MERIYFENLKEEVFYEKLESGLNVYLVPKKGFNKTLVNMSVKVGSFIKDIVKGDDKIIIPKGTAHLLEHILFYKKYGNVNTRYSEGFKINGYTSNKSTNFISCSSFDIEKNIEVVFDIVWDFYSSKEIIDNEKKIILKELEINKDNLNDFIIEKTADLMFDEKIFNIEESEEDIDTINEQDLKYLYNGFYLGDNASLIIMGKFEEEEVMKIIYEKDKKIRSGIPLKNGTTNKNIKIKGKRDNLVSFEEKICSLGISFDIEDIKSPKEYYKLECVSTLILEALKYKYEKYDNIRINMDINSQYNYIILYKNINNNESFSDEFSNDINNLDIDSKYLDKLKNIVIAKEIMSMDDLQDYMFNFVKHIEDNQMYLDFEKVILDITIDDINNVKQKLCDRKNHINVLF